MPPIAAQFFYSSTIPIDDPLSASINTGTSDKRSIKSLLRPFGRGDNNALESAWLDLGAEDDRFKHQSLLYGKKLPASASSSDAAKRDRLVQALAHEHVKLHAGAARAMSKPVRDAYLDPENTTELCCPRLHGDIASELLGSVCSISRAVETSFDADNLAKDISAIVLNRRMSTNEPSNAIASPIQVDTTRVPGRSSLDSPRSSAQMQSKLGHGSGSNAILISRSRRAELSGSNNRDRSDSQLSERSALNTPIAGSRGSPRHSIANDGITGRPFVRVDVEHRAGSVSSSLTKDEPIPQKSKTTEGALQENETPEQRSRPEKNAAAKTIATEPIAAEGAEVDEDSKQITVGVSRLHMVVLPALQMKPIYWSPINDMAVVTRGTWFYRCVFIVPTSRTVPTANSLPEILCYQFHLPWQTNLKRGIKICDHGQTLGSTSCDAL